MGEGNKLTNKNAKRNNYKHLRRVWFSGKYATKTEMCKELGLNYNSFCIKSAKWSQDEDKIKDKAMDKAADQLAAMQIRHIEVGNELIDMGMDNLKNKKLNNVEALNAVRLGTSVVKEVLVKDDKQIGGGVTIQFIALQNGDVPRPKIVEAEVIDSVDITTPVIDVPRHNDKPNN